MTTTSFDVTNGTPAAPERISSHEQALPSDLPTALLALLIQSRGAQTSASRQEIEGASELAERARKEIEEAMARAKDAQEDAGFWGSVASIFGGDVAAILGAIAAAATIVATGGAGAPAVVALAAAGLTSASTIGRELGLDANVCRILGAAGAVLGIATGNLGAAAGAASGTASALATASSTIATTAKTLQAGATAAGGLATAVEGHYHGEALHAEADGRAAQGREDDAWFRMDVAISLLEQAARDLQRGAGSATELQRSDHEGRTALIARIGAVA